MATTTVFYITFLLLVVWTIKNLPLINVDAATWFQLKMVEFMRWLDKNDK